MPELLSINRRITRTTILLRFVVACLCFESFCSQAASLTASLDNYSVLLGETVTLTLTVENGTPDQVSEIPTIDGLVPSGGRASGFNSRMDQNGTTTVRTYSRPLRPTRTGEFVIPPFQAKVDGQILTTQPLKLKVAAEESAAPPPQFANRPLFLWAVPAKTNIFLGEAVTLELRLYVRSDIRRVGGLNTPFVADGFTVSQMLQGNSVQRRIGPGQFTMIPLFFALIPVKTGALTLSSPDASIIINPRDPFDFFGPQPQQYPLKLDPLTFNVSPLPQDQVPRTFTGAVGKYSLSFTAGPTNVTVGDPITARIQINGEGAIETLTLPEQPRWKDFKSYPPTSKAEEANALGVQGTKSFEQVILPQSTNITEIPGVVFTFFDPDRKSYVTLNNAGIPLTVRPAGAITLPSIAAPTRGQTENPPARDIVPIKQRIGIVAQATLPLIQRPWFLALQGVPLLAFVFSLTWRRRADSLAHNPRRQRQQQVARVVRKGLADLKQAAAQNDSDAFFAGLFRLLQEQLGERLDVPASAITEAVIEERLQPKQVSESTLEQLRELFQACNAARYAPIRSSHELAAIVPSVENALHEVQQLKL